MAKIKCPIWQLLATTHAHCHKCGRLTLTISYSDPYQSQKSKQNRQVIYMLDFLTLTPTYSLFRFYQIIFCVAFFNWTAFHTCPLELGLELEPNIWKFIIFARTLKQFLDSYIFAIFVCYHICFFKSITLHLHTSSPNWQLITLTIWRQPSPRTICPSTLGQRAE